MTDILRESQSSSGPALDAIVEVNMSENQLEAYVQLTPPMNGGKIVTLDWIMREIANHGIVYGIDHVAIQSLIENPKYGTNVVIAKGIPPKDGENGKIVWHVETNSSRQPKEGPDGSIDLRNLGVANNVQRGQVLCTIQPPTTGVQGRSVKGNILTPAVGKKAPSPLGKNVVLNEDETQLISAIDGQLNVVGNKVSVEQTLVIDGDIDNSTGNIHFIGNVVIRGGVNSGFTVEAHGSIDISGFVEAATIKAGGDIILRCGMNGASKGFIECGGNLNCTFLENADITVQGNLNTQYMVHCQVRVGGDIELVGRKASIVGGYCIAGGNISTKSIGNQYGLKSEIVLGVGHSLIARQKELTKELPEMMNQIESLTKIINMLSPLHAANALPPERVEMLNSAKHSIGVAIRKFEDTKAELEEINEKVKSHTKGKITCTGTIHPGTIVTIGHAKYSVNNPLTFTTLYYSEGEVTVGSA